RHAGRDATSVLEIGCGPGYHVRALSRHGLRAVGLDLSAPMIQLARERADAEGTIVEWLVADMRDFHLDEPVDLAVCYFDGIDALLDTDDLLHHLETVAQNLAPGGLYVIDCTHPRDCSYTNYGDYTYSGERDGVKVDIIWATNGPKIDPLTGVAEVGLEMHVQDNGFRHVIRDVARERCFTPQEINLLVRLSGAFEIAGWYGDFDVHQKLDNSPQSRRMIAVLQKRGA
ncbi:MAG TPA: class I SAM-dependent methyltransferase, partial [Rhodothermales bacterium]|nr:class I SAM-dependent methyltransferase [Rhodothermales bacterium]